MKTITFVLLLALSMSFVIVGCSDKQNSPVSPSEQTISSPGSLTSMAKKDTGVAITEPTAAWYGIWWSSSLPSVMIQIKWVPVKGAKTYKVEYAINNVKYEWLGNEGGPIYSLAVDGSGVAALGVGPGGNAEPKADIVVGTPIDITVTAFRENSKVIFSTTKTIIVTDRLNMIPVAGGIFTAGTTLTSIGSFAIDKYEVTYEKWMVVRTWGLANGYSDLVAGTNGFSPVQANNPVTEVNWYDIVKWCNARSEKDGLTPVYYTNNTLTTMYKTGSLDLLPDCVNWNANGYRLPTEAEWEFAAKGGTMARSPEPYIYSGSSILDDVAWYVVNSNIRTHAVGTKNANELGIYDMSGNVFEWCWDIYSATYPSGSIDPKGLPSTTLTKRILRGGSFAVPEDYCRSANRNSSSVPDYRNVNCGFRCVQD